MEAEQRAALEAEWTLQPDGMWFREGARVLVIDDGRVLLQHARESSDPNRTYWFTPGGGVSRDESQREAAARELAEETGMLVSAAELIGPVAERDVILPFLGTIVHQHEVFFLAPAVSASAAPARTAFEEREFMEQVWVPVADVQRLPDPVYPPDMSDLLAHVLPHWDGTVLTLAPEDSREAGSASS